MAVPKSDQTPHFELYDYGAPSSKKAAKAIDQAIHRAISEAFRQAATKNIALFDALIIQIRDRVSPVLNLNSNLGALDSASKNCVAFRINTLLFDRVGSIILNSPQLLMSGIYDCLK